MKGAIALALSALIIALITGVTLGSGGFTEDPFILWQLRLPRTLLALAAGASLAACGLLMQALLQNPLASPYTLGVGSGAALGAALAFRLGSALSVPSWAVALLTLGGAGVLAKIALPLSRLSAAALGLTGALLALLLLYGHHGNPVALGAVLGAGVITLILTRLNRRADLQGDRLLLAGVTLSLSASAGVLLLFFLLDRAASAQMLRWTMGSVTTVGFADAQLAGLLTLGGLLALAPLLPQLNQLLFGEATAASRGVPVMGLRRFILVFAALWTAGIVALTGPLGFIGLIAPHAARQLVGDDLRKAAPLAVSLGAASLALCDAVARVALSAGELPVGVLTALLGGPFFLSLMLRRRS